MSDAADWPRVAIHPAQHPARLDPALDAAFAQRRLPAKIHYLSQRQALRWMAVHAAHAPSRAEGAEHPIYDAAGDALAALLGAGPVQLASLGCGGGGKDARIAARLAASGVSPLRYLAADASLPLTLIAGDAVAATGVPVRRLVFDLDDLSGLDTHLAAAAPEGERRAVLALGVVPNCDAAALLRELAELLRTGDALLISANLYDPTALTDILPQYDNAETRRWLATALEDRDWPTDPGAIAFHIEEGVPARIVATLPDPTGTPVELFFSNRFRAADFAALMTAAGLTIRQNWRLADGAEGLWLVRR